MYYDLEQEGIVFPYYYGNHFVGAQVRFIEPRVKEDGSLWKITTLPGTRLGLLFGLWNQDKFITDIKAVVVCEGYFNALSLQQAFNARYGGVSHNPWRFVATSGSGLSDHQAEALKELKEKGFKIVGAFDTDSAGLKGLNKMIEKECITHYSLTNDTEKDWNDILKESGPKGLAKLFLQSVVKNEQ
jgi:DNA primase